jgi:hypothetical protein
VNKAGGKIDDEVGSNGVISKLGGNRNDRSVTVGTSECENFPKGLVEASRKVGQRFLIDAGGEGLRSSHF